MDPGEKAGVPANTELSPGPGERSDSVSTEKPSSPGESRRDEGSTVTTRYVAES